MKPIALMAVLLAIAAASIAQPVQIVTEEFPPYDFTNDEGRVDGLATDVVRAVLAEAGSDAEIRILPWARAYKLAVQTPNTMLFSVVRTAERESLFYWVGVVCEVKSYLYKLRSRVDITANQLPELREYTVGVVRGWAGEQYLIDHAFGRMEAVADSDLNIKKLLTGRVDLIEDYEANVVFRLKRLGIRHERLEKLHFNAAISGKLYAVFNRATPPEVVARFREAFARVHDDGRYDFIREKWLKEE